MATDHYYTRSREECREVLRNDIRNRPILICHYPPKATVIFDDGRTIRVCGVHARQREREMENVIWDARFDQRGTRV